MRPFLHVYSFHTTSGGTAHRNVMICLVHREHTVSSNDVARGIRKLIDIEIVVLRVKDIQGGTEVFYTVYLFFIQFLFSIAAV